MGRAREAVGNPIIKSMGFKITPDLDIHSTHDTTLSKMGITLMEQGVFFCRAQPSRGRQARVHVIILTTPCKGCTAPDPQRPRCSLSRCTGCELPHLTASANGQSRARADLPVSSPGDPASPGPPLFCMGWSPLCSPVHPSWNGQHAVPCS